SVVGLEQVSRISPQAAAMIFVFAVAHFMFWYGLHLAAGEQTLAATQPFETSDYINSGDPEGRLAVEQKLKAATGRQLVFVRFAPLHTLQEWIRSGADIDAARIVWALDLGRGENAKLRKYYPDRTAWLLEPDDHPPRLGAYPLTPALHFEEIH